MNPIPYLRQLRALFWKNFLIRKRHWKTFLGLEILLPIVLFALLAVWRSTIPPVHRNTCEYPERALPGAGLFPFLQSSLCTMNNTCFTRELNEERAEAQKRLQTTTRIIHSLVNKPTTIDAFKALPSVSTVFKTIIDVATGTKIDGIDKKVVIRNMFKDPYEVAYILSDKYNILEKQIAMSLLNASLNAVMLPSVAEVDIIDWICDNSKFEDMIDVKPESDLDIEIVSRQFCSFGSKKAVIDEIFQQLDIVPLIEDLVVSGINGNLQKSNVTLEATKDGITKLVIANDDMGEIRNTLKDFAETIPEAFSSLAHAQTGNEDFGSLSAILCGTDLPMTKHEFNTGAGHDGRKDLNEKQTEELKSLPGNACKDMYLKIMDDRNGPMIWAYLKPLLRGKIVYVPNTPEVRRIIAQINTTFSLLEEFSKLAIVLSEGLVALGDVTGSKARELRDLINSNVTKSMRMELAGLDIKDLDVILYTLGNTDMEMMKGISKVAKVMNDYISCLLLDRFEGFDTEKEMEKAAKSLAADKNLFAGVVFEMPNDSKSKTRQSRTEISKHIYYKIRMDVENVPDTEKLKGHIWRPRPYDDFFKELRYFKGFIQLQDLIDQAIISLHAGPNVMLPSTTTNQFPFPCHTLDHFVHFVAGYLLIVLMMLSWLPGVSVAVYNFVYDRERGQEETLAAMGMKSGLNWIAWFLSTLIVMAIVALVDVIILRYLSVFINSDMAIMYIYFLAFIFSSIMLCYLASAFFTRTSVAMLACIIVYVVSYLPFAVVFSLELRTQFWQKTLACLSSTAAFSFATRYIMLYEEQNIGVQWDNIRDAPVIDDDYSFYWCYIMILIDGVIYFFLGWYVRNVKPGKFGVAEPWNFIFVYFMQFAGEIGFIKQETPAEEMKSDTSVVLSAKGLSKTFSDGTKAVTDLSLDIQCGNVTTLLGHNGAAKTTTMNMLIGVLEPSSGDIRILNRPLKEMKGYLGICSQHNALYDYMTVKEHMEFYTSMKGSSIHELSAKDEIRQLLNDVDLYYCRNMLVKNLSGGMQRRLCVALAFIGGSKAVILDEPTSGVDPSGRRAIWNLIISRKSETAVLLSTHHLDEADIISDQIAILHRGNLLCQGSPVYLKKHLANGHRLTFVKETRDTDQGKILALLNRLLPGVKLCSTAGAEMTFVLPAANEAEFHVVFQELESQKHDLGIVSYGISDPKLEEVFMKVCSAADVGKKISPETLDIEEEEIAAQTDSQRELKHCSEKTAFRSIRTRLSKVCSGHGGVFWALLVKRFHHYRRDWRIILSTLGLPLMVVFGTLGCHTIKPDAASSSPKILLTPAVYGPNTYVFMQQSSSNFQLGNDIFDTFMRNPGIGTSCMEDVKLGDQFECVTPDIKFSDPPLNTSTEGRCFCDDNRYICKKSPYGVNPEERITPTTEILQNLKGRDINKYLLNSFPEFILKRFGGWSIDGKSDDTDSNLKAKIWYDHHGYHALPSFYNAYSNGLLRALMKDSPDASKYGISTYNHPFTFEREQLNKFSLNDHAADTSIAIMILLAFTFIPVGVLLYSVYENTSKEKHMQFISGVAPFTYWMASLVWDLFVLGVAICVTMIILMIFKPGSFWDRKNFEATVCLLLFYGWATITFSYLLVKRFNNSGTAFLTVFCTLMFIGIFCVIIITSCNYLQSSDAVLGRAYKVLPYVFLVFPPYALAGGLLDLTDNHIRTVILEQFDTDVYKDPFTFDMIGLHLFAMGIEGLLYLILTIWIDVKYCCNRRYECSINESTDEDSDVIAEKRRIDTENNKDDVVIVRNLYKTYIGNGKEVHAVRGLSFGVPAGQCFGLLGVNGAGKSSTFNVLTGVTDASYGHCDILGNKIEPGSSTVGRNMGYCSQNNALDPFLSITNTLYFHAKLKGIDNSSKRQAVEKVMNMLDLHRIRNKLVKSCSGGMKRKVSLAVALLGDPAVVLLDEPTTGMDPKAKRLVWNCLLEAKKNGQAIILTSHSLEECDILCDRIGIMVNGKFKCLGTSQHLKQKYGDGLTVTLYVEGLSDSFDKISELRNKHFPEAGVTELHVHVVQLDVPRGSIGVADLFGILEREKGSYNILYYTVSQTTLDTIFINFAREQSDRSLVKMSDSHSTSCEIE